MLDVFLYVFFWPAMIIDWLSIKMKIGGVFSGKSSLIYFGSAAINAIYLILLAFLLVSIVK